MHGISIEDKNLLQRYRVFYERRNTTAPDEIEPADCLNVIQFLLKIISDLELSPFRSLVPPLNGHVVYITGRYKEGSVKHVLQFAHFSPETDREKIRQKIYEKFAHSLLLGLVVDGIQFVPIEDKTLLIGTGIGG